MTGAVSKLKRAARAFAFDRRGAIAPLMVVSLVPVLVGVGVAIDIARLTASRASLQDAVDAANLALAREPASTSPSDLKSKAEAWIRANLDDGNVQNVSVATPTRTLGQIQLDATGTVSTSFSGLLGVTTMGVEGHSTVKYGTSEIELALVLDNTGSMNSDGKLDALKSAANTLVNTLEESAVASGNPNALKIGVVPFSMTVNVGNAYQTTNWITGSMPDAYGATADAIGGTNHPDRFQLFRKLNTAWGGCIESRPMPYDVSDAPPVAAVPASMFVPFFAPDEPDPGYYRLGSNVYYHYSNRSGQITWVNNYANDSYNADSNSINRSNVGSSDYLARQTNSSKYNSSPASGSHLFWGDAIGPNAGCRIKPLLRLTTDMTAVRDKLKEMVATGDTEIPLGLVWGWHLLSPNAPFMNGSAYGTKGKLKIIVLVTDGVNTYASSNNINQSYYTAYGYAASKRISSAGTAPATASALDDRLNILCGNLKGKNSDGSNKVYVYTVPIGVSEGPTKTALQNCASQPDYFIDVDGASGIEDAFKDIAGKIAGLRIAK